MSIVLTDFSVIFIKIVWGDRVQPSAIHAPGNGCPVSAGFRAGFRWIGKAPPEGETGRDCRGGVSPSTTCKNKKDSIIMRSYLEIFPKNKKAYCHSSKNDIFVSEISVKTIDNNSIICYNSSEKSNGGLRRENQRCNNQCYEIQRNNADRTGKTVRTEKSVIHFRTVECQIHEHRQHL